MLILIALIVIIIMIICYYNGEDEWGGTMAIFLGAVIFTILVCTAELSSGLSINEKIEMYELENSIIEKKVKDTVTAYMDFEEETYENLIKDADLTVLLVKYPELNSHNLVKTEMDLYISNNIKIKELKEQKIDLVVTKWWLYFGGK